MHPFAFVVAFNVLLWLTLTISTLVNNVQRTPYMDEVFHIPQAQNYCVHNFTHWDPMITTPPGLYFTSLAWIRLAAIFTTSDFCTVYGLRFTNVLLTAGNMCASYLISIKLEEHSTAKTRVRLILSATVVTLLPVLYFFSFLYYTDPGTVFFLQLMYLYYLFEHHWLAAVFGGIAVLFRQTSIAWVFMLACCRVSLILEETGIRCMSDAMTVMKRLVSDCFGYVAVGAAFVAFVVCNGSIVLGDKTAHQPCFHVAQLGYFLLFTLVHGAPYLLAPSVLRDFCSSVRRRPGAYATALSIAAAVVQKYSYAHPYLLSDNRHFTFYLWRKLLGKSVTMQRALVPIYFYAGYALLRQLRHKSPTWRLLFCLALTVSTVPQKLLELRYFIVPYLFFRLNVKSPSYAQLLLEAAVYCTVNTVTLYLFLVRTFFWTGDPVPQRFMW